MGEPPDSLDPNTPTVGPLSPNAPGAAEPIVPGVEPSPAPAVLGRYEVRRSLGSGGFGQVYLGFDARLGRDVAIKVLHASYARTLGEGDPSLEEARKLARLRHPGIVAVHDIGVYEGRVYVVSDYLDGPDLAQWLRGHRPLWPAATRIVAAVADALNHAHARLIVHRDVKPANIILAAEGAPVLVDFGLALSEEQAGGGAKGFVSGTPWYMSPEQAQGTAHRIDGRTDIYSLGVVLYELLTGRVPFRATDARELIRQLCDDEPQPPRQLVGEIPPKLERVCLKALEKRQQDRYTTAGDLAEDLRTVLAAAEASTSTPTPSGATANESPIPTAAISGRPTPAVRRSSRGAERRQLTVLVCGCEVFESEVYLALDVEDQARVLRVFQEGCEEAVHQFGGTVVHNTAEGLLACFGFPLAYEDAASRAAQAGLAIVQTMRIPSQYFQVDEQSRLRPWIGIHTGRAIVEFRDDAVSLVGEARNIALRLEDVAVAGQVICTESSHRIFQGRFHCASLGQKSVKGIGQLIELFRVEYVKATGSLIEAVTPAELSPLTGRDHEISLLIERWEQAQEGMGQVVLLIGEPGVGKSRLVHTMKQHVRGMLAGSDGTPVIEWRCSPHSQDTSLHPAIDFFERALAFDREEAPADRFDRTLRYLEEHGLAQAETVPLWASLLSLPLPARFSAVSLSPVRQREETFRALVDWLHTRAAERPILFVVEDLHWVDASTLEFLGLHLIEGPREPLLTVLTCRPEFKTPWPAVAHQTTLALNRLTQRQVGDLMRRKTGTALPEALIQRVYERTGGVPLFVEEFTKMLYDSGAAYAGPKGGLASELLHGREIPATLQDLVMARLDRTEGGRDLAQLAAALGREFSYELLAAVADLDQRTLQVELANLVQAEILFSRGRPPHSTYVFKHALLEDALYNALVKERRQQFHRRIADALEERFSQVVETRPEVLAHHCTEAGLAKRAVGWWLKAGLRAREKSAEVEAIGHLTRGLSLVRTFAESHDRDVLELPFLNPLATAYMVSSGYAAPEAGPVFQRALDLSERVGDPQQRFALGLGISEWHAVRGDWPQCSEIAAQLVQLAERHDDLGMVMEASLISSIGSYFRGDFRAAHKGLVAACRHDDRERTRYWAAYSGSNAGVGSLCFLTMSLWQLGFPDQA